MFADPDLADGHAADRCRSLGVEEDEQAGEPVFGLEVAVVQEPPRDVPAVLVIEEPRGSVPSGGRGEVAGGELAAAGPADEPAGFLAVDSSLAGEPTVEVGLLAAVQGEVVRVEQVKERDGAAGQPPGHVGLLPGGTSVVPAAPSGARLLLERRSKRGVHEVVTDM